MEDDLVRLREDEIVCERVFTASPLVLVGTKEEDGDYNLAPKHMALPLGWQDYFGFVCTPRHRTYHNARRERSFTVTYPRPTQVLLASLAASPREEANSKPLLDALIDLPGQRGGRGLPPGRVPVLGVPARPHHRRLRGGRLDRRPHRGGPRPSRLPARLGERRPRPHLRLTAPGLLEPWSLRRLQESFSFPFPANFMR